MILLRDESETEALGRRLARALGGHGAVYISGHLGAGKTCLCRALLRELGHKGAVKSPTFTLVEPYELGNGLRVFHLDLYRISDPHELDYLGMEDCFGDDCISLVEWPERAAGRLPAQDLALRIAGRGQARQVVLTGCSAHGERVCLELLGQYGKA